jgi:hypothetical protein
MATVKMDEKSQHQYHEFVDAARALECDESEERFNEALGKIVRHKPKPDAQPEKTETPDEKEPAK